MHDGRAHPTTKTRHYPIEAIDNNIDFYCPIQGLGIANAHVGKQWGYKTCLTYLIKYIYIRRKCSICLALGKPFFFYFFPNWIGLDRVANSKDFHLYAMHLKIDPFMFRPHHYHPNKPVFSSLNCRKFSGSFSPNSLLLSGSSHSEFYGV